MTFAALAIPRSFFRPRQGGALSNSIFQTQARIARPSFAGDRA